MYHDYAVSAQAAANDVYTPRNAAAAAWPDHRMTLSTSERSRQLNPVEKALERAAIQVLREDGHTWDAGYPATIYWHDLVAGLKALGALGAVKRPSGWAIVWELFPDDTDYYGLAGDGRGDLFAVGRDNVLDKLTF